jgi:hypothetical protein
MRPSSLIVALSLAMLAACTVPTLDYEARANGEAPGDTDCSA